MSVIITTDRPATSAEAGELPAGISPDRVRYVETEQGGQRFQWLRTDIRKPAP